MPDEKIKSMEVHFKKAAKLPLSILVGILTSKEICFIFHGCGDNFNVVEIPYVDEENPLHDLARNLNPDRILFLDITKNVNER